MFERISKQQLKENPEIQMRNFRSRKKYLVAIDTDGCITDNMNGKQMLIFHPQYMEFYQLWEIESYFRETAEFYNLFSIYRGCNRFIALQLTLSALHSRTDVQSAAKQTSTKIPSVEVINRYIEFCMGNNLGPGNPSLEIFLETNPLDLEIYKLLGWSEAVNRNFPFISMRIPPFENAIRAFEIMNEMADIIVVSQTPYDDLVDYWEFYGLLRYVRIVCGQEMGSKAHHIEVIKENGGYSNENILMIGDGDGDLKAARKNNVCFYPVFPGKETDSWERFSDIFMTFINGRYTMDMEKKMIDEFSTILIKNPVWERQDYNHIQAYREKQNIRKSLYEKLNPDGRLLTF